MGKKRGRNCSLVRSHRAQTNRCRRTLDMPSPARTPSPRRTHHRPAPPIPARPVPLAHAPSAVLLALSDGNVVVN
jgi:hypothetical protein